MTTFTQIVFPQKLKPPVEVISNETTSSLFSVVYCTKKDDWVSLICCLRCKCAERTLEEIMSDCVGC